MKKYNLFKVIGIVILVTWLLTFFIPGSQMDYSGNIVKGDIAPVGIWTLFSDFSISISYFSNIAILLIAIAIFYGILSKINVYNDFVSKTAEKFKKKPGLLVTISALFFGILSLFVSDSLLLLVFIPFVIQVMKKLSIDSKTILASTIVASFIGSISKIYEPNLFKAFNITVNTLLLVRIIIFVLNIFALIIIITPRKKNSVSETKKAEKTSSKNENSKPVKKASAKKVVKKSQPKKKTTGRGRS